MSSVLAAMQALASQDAEQGRDLNVAEKGGGGGRLLPEGYAFARLVEYTEYGNQPQEFQGKAKDPLMEFSLGFALTGQGYQNEDGTPYVLRTFNISMSLFEKSRAFKLFKLLNWQGLAKGYGQLLGATYLVKVVHVAKSKTDATIVSRLDLDSFLPPLDPVTKAPYGIAECPDDLYRLFLWNNPTLEGWKALEIEGTTDAGKSRNFIQETILGALNFQGSPLQQLLGGGGLALPTAAPVATAPLAATVAPVQVAASAPVVAATVANETVSAVVAAPVAPVVAEVAPVVAPTVAAPVVAAVAPVATPSVVSAPVVPAVAPVVLPV